MRGLWHGHCVELTRYCRYCLGIMTARDSQSTLRAHVIYRKKVYFTMGVKEEMGPDGVSWPRVKGESMKNKILMSFVALSFLLMMGGATAYAQVTGEVVATVPFAFTVENTTLPAGTYVISSPVASDASLIEIHQENGVLSVLALTESVDPAQQASVPKTELVFDRIGDRDFLRQVWEEGNAQGDEILKSKQQTKLEQSGGKAQRHRLAAKHRKRSK
jgi:hypothetical protein